MRGEARRGAGRGAGRGGEARGEGRGEGRGAVHPQPRPKLKRERASEPLERAIDGGERRADQARPPVQHTRCEGYRAACLGQGQE